MFDTVLDTPTATRMIEARRKRESWFWRSPHPSKRPGRETWRTPEFAILSIAKSFAQLRQDGLSEVEAMARIDDRRNLGVLEDGVTTLEAYIRLVLARHVPKYLRFGDSHLHQVLALAQADLAKRFNGKTAGKVKDWSESTWKKEQIYLDEFRQTLAKRLHGGPMLFPRDGFDEALTQFLVRMQDGDELWGWRSPRETRGMMIGGGGISLVRDNRAIATLLPMMN